MRVPGATGLVPLAERTNVLHGFRLAMVAGVLGTAALAPARLGGSIGRLVPATAVYVVAAVAAEVLRRAGGRRWLALIGAVLLADGAWIAAVMAFTGGPRSLMGVLVPLHVVAVTLLASYRTGLKITVWHSILFVVAHALHSAGVSSTWELPAFAGAPALSNSEVVAGVVSFLVLAVGTAVFSSVNERELRRSRAELLARARMGTELQDVQSTGEVGRVVLSWVHRTFEGPRAAVVLGNEDGIEQIWIADASGVHLGSLDETNRAPGEVLLRSWRQHEQQPQLVRSLGPDSPVLDRVLPAARNLVVAPMTADGRPIGALIVEKGGSPGTSIRSARVDSLAEFAAHAALSLRSACLVAEVERMARIDDLTGLANRRNFEETLEREAARATRNGEALSVVLLDVDHFKRINDTLGHEAGDEVLRLVGRALDGTVRKKIDLAARYGGEEFVLVLPNCLASAAVRVAEEARSAIASRCAEFAVTASAGVATFPGTVPRTMDLVSAADAALYQSKRTGRDRVTVAETRAPVAEATGAGRRLEVPA